jgi:DNA-binding response OmpR family regulator
MKVLVVDDDPISRKLLRTYLEKWGYQVTQAEDGAVGWSLFQTDDFPLVIADWMMPEMDGVELVRRIRAHERPGFVYCILLTARSHKEDLVEGMDAGADDFLSKPFDRDELRVRLREGERIVTLERAAAQPTPTAGSAAPESAGDASLAAEIEQALSAAVDELTPLRGQVSESASHAIDRVLEHLARARGAAEQRRHRA